MKFTPVTLTGRHVRLEPLDPRHYAGLERAGADREVWQWMTFPHADPQESVRQWCGAVSAMQSRGEALAFAIFEMATGEAVGGEQHRPDGRDGRFKAQGPRANEIPVVCLR